MKTILEGTINMEGKSLPNEITDMFSNSKDIPTVSAFVQQRDKVKPEAFEAVFDKFTAKIRTNTSKMAILAVDDSNVRLPDNPNDKSTYLPGSKTQLPYNCLHINALYDLKRNIYQSVIIQNGAHKQNSAHKDEHIALQQLVDSSEISKALVIVDRGYESYNNMAHIQENGWFFLIRIKDGKYGIKSGLDLPDEDCFDLNFELNLTKNKQTK